LRVRLLPPGRERELGVALLAGGIAWIVHGAYDWDWDSPGVTVPALLMLGIVAALPARPRATVPGDTLVPSTGLRPLALAGAALLACAAITSAVLPAWSQSKSDDALAAAGSATTQGQLQRAAAEADLAAKPDPLAVEPLVP